MVKHTTVKTKSNQKQFAQVAPELSTKVWADKPAKVENKRGLTAMMNDVIQEYTNEANKLAQNSKPKNTDHDKKIQTMMTNINDTADQIKHAKETISQKVNTVQKDFITRFESYDRNLSRIFQLIQTTEITIHERTNTAKTQWNTEGENATQELHQKVKTMIHRRK